MTKTTRLLDPETPTTTEAEEPQTAVSPVRFYCLFVVTMLAGLQGAWWNNFGPISAAVNPFYGWDDATIALLSNWGPIGYFVAVVPTAWLLDVAGIRASCIVGMTLVFGGSVLRCLYGGAGAVPFHWPCYRVLHLSCCFERGSSGTHSLQGQSAPARAVILPR